MITDGKDEFNSSVVFFVPRSQEILRLLLKQPCGSLLSPGLSLAQGTILMCADKKDIYLYAAS